MFELGVGDAVPFLPQMIVWGKRRFWRMFELGVGDAVPFLLVPRKNIRCAKAGASGGGIR